MHSQIIERLKRGETIKNFRESGNSMTPVIKHREPVTIAPVDVSKLERGDIVLAKVRGHFYTHRVNAIQGDRVQIANNHGHVNGWTNFRHVYGIVIEVSGKPISSAKLKIKNS